MQIMNLFESLRCENYYGEGNIEIVSLRFKNKKTYSVLQLNRFFNLYKIQK
jgi:hypothetical protein